MWVFVLQTFWEWKGYFLTAGVILLAFLGFRGKYKAEGREEANAEVARQSQEQLTGAINDVQTIENDVNSSTDPIGELHREWDRPDSSR